MQNEVRLLKIFFPHLHFHYITFLNERIEGKTYLFYLTYQVKDS